MSRVKYSLSLLFPDFPEAGVLPQLSLRSTNQVYLFPRSRFLRAVFRTDLLSLPQLHRPQARSNREPFVGSVPELVSFESQTPPNRSIPQFQLRVGTSSFRQSLWLLHE